MLKGGTFPLPEANPRISTADINYEILLKLHTFFNFIYFEVGCLEYVRVDFAKKNILQKRIAKS